VKYALGGDDLRDLRVALQGAGNVGFDLARQLAAAGAKLWVSDLYADNAQRAADELGATVVAPADIYGLDVEVFAPCAMGARAVRHGRRPQR